MVGKMFTFLVIVTVVVAIGLLLVAAMRPVYSVYSLPELTRRAKKDEGAKRVLERQLLLGDIETLLRTASVMLFVGLVCLLIAVSGWGMGVILALIIGITYPALARMSLFSKPSAALYKSIEPSLLKFAASTKPLFHFLRGMPFYKADDYRRFDSREELAELIDDAKDVLSSNERALISSALVFNAKTVASVMTPRNVIDFIQKSEFLGPLVLSELSALGHSRLPVVDRDLDHVEGILHLRDLLSLDIKRSVTAEKAMEPKVYYIHQDDTLEHALAAFLKTRHHLFIVLNDQRETVGLLTLEDVLEALIGRRIVDEDDIHDDLRAVAQREGKANNAAPGHVDL